MMIQPQIDFCCFRLVAINIALTHCYKLVSFLNLIILGTAKSTDCKFGRYIHRVHPNTSPLKIGEKSQRGRIQGPPYFFEYPLLSQERIKLRTSNLAGSSEQKPMHELNNAGHASCRAACHICIGVI